MTWVKPGMRVRVISGSMNDWRFRGVEGRILRVGAGDRMKPRITVRFNRTVYASGTVITMVFAEYELEPVDILEVYSRAVSDGDLNENRKG